MSDYRAMWEGLGLDLEAHDALLAYSTPRSMGLRRHIIV
jgi:hypothetical protein